MPDYQSRIDGDRDGFAAGDDLFIRRTINRAASKMPDGVVVTAAWFTVKEKEGNLDTAAILQKKITTTEVAGVGQIENDGTGDVNPVLRFDLTASDTRKILDRLPEGGFFDIQFKTNDDKIHTPERGTISVPQDITRSTS